MIDFAPAKIFEQLAAAYFAAHPSLVYEWQHVPKKGWLRPERFDLVVPPLREGGVKVWATMNDGQLTVGDSDANKGGRIILGDADHRDFEDFGRNVTDDALAQEAFDYFVALLKRHGFVPA